MLIVSQINKGVPEMDENGFVFNSSNLILVKAQKLITVLAGSLVRFLQYEEASCRDF
jgi:hypothetical protein